MRINVDGVDLPGFPSICGGELRRIRLVLRERVAERRIRRVEGDRGRFVFFIGQSENPAVA